MSPFREIDHTADWALRVWAPSLPELFVDAARGMYHLSGAGGSASPPGAVHRRLELAGSDAESLLVAWLQELLYLAESEGLVFDQFTIEALTPEVLRAEVVGRPLVRLDKVIKAVTYHNLVIRPIEGGYEVTVVFDV